MAPLPRPLIARSGGGAFLLSTILMWKAGLLQNTEIGRGRLSCIPLIEDRLHRLPQGLLLVCHGQTPFEELYERIRLSLA
ncbi:MAG: hypothetical protein UY38_C0002G0153 [Parcubacteria group bacterium GW2011_GWB1_49_12]|nr:MAG: hypothetical protein UY38_C0002G0153 [Parcubacteria group bacterium GW2011_GWB1_49_12]